MATFKCPDCGHENILGSDHCSKCLHSFTQKDGLQPTKDKLQHKIMTEKVSDFISKIPSIIVRADTPVSEMIKQMQANPTKGAALVCDDKGMLIGIASIRDVLLKVAGVVKEKDLASYPVSKIMTSKPECLQKNEMLAVALQKMSIGKFRHVPVVENGKPIGIVSTRDLIEYLADQK